MIIQVCFSLKGKLTLDLIEDKLKTLKLRMDKLYGEGNYEIHSCHLNKEALIEKGIPTEIPDLFESLFGNKYVCEIKSPHFQDALQEVDQKRTELSKKSNKLVILVGDDIGNVDKELGLFTDDRVIIL